MASALTSSWSFQQPLTIDILKSSCQSAQDDVKRLKPLSVVHSKGSGEIKMMIRSFYVYIPSQLCTTLFTQQEEHDDTTSLRIILAIHGFGGRPIQEIRKWNSVATSLDAVILAPQGTGTNKAGWNALDCCGDPVIQEIDDIHFINNGVVDVFLKEFANIRRDDYQTANIIALGFSNGGFMSSLLGLQTVDDRPSWLVGIVPMAGYQYGVDLYKDKHQHPIPILAHHGGKDSVVKPDGCCTSEDNPDKSNCPFDIGIERQTCTSVKSAFEMWSQINECQSTIQEDVTNDRRINDEGLEPIYTCWKGTDCTASTTLCMWNNECHCWAFQFPGANMTQSWMEEIFHHEEELQKGNANEELTKESSHAYYVHNGTGRILFLVAITFSLAMVLFCYIISKTGGGKGRKNEKRKTSEENLEEFQLVLSNNGIS